MVFYVLIVVSWFAGGVRAEIHNRLWLVVLTLAGLRALSLAHREKTMSPDFTALLLTGIAFGAAVLWFMAWRFGGANMWVFVVVAGLSRR